MTSLQAPSVQSQIIYYDDQYLSVCEPKTALAKGAVEIIVKDETNLATLYERIYIIFNKLKNHWNEPGVNGAPLAVGRYYVERRDENTKSVMRQIIPYPNSGIWSIPRQIQVAWNLLFPSLALSWHTPEAEQLRIKAALAKSYEPSVPRVVKKEKCAFCNPQRIQAQRIFEYATGDCLTNFSPLLKQDKLFVAKKHIQDFDQESFVQGMTWGAKVGQEYAKIGYPISYQTFADDPASGQTIPHAHIHQTSARAFADELWGIAKVVRKIFIDSWAAFIVPSLFRLSDAKLGVIIAEEQKNLAAILPSTK
jgi:hypothetical protein